MMKNRGSHKCSKISKVLTVLIIAVLFYTGNTYAEKDEVYKNLIIFSDVIDEIEKNYVDSVEADELIKRAIQGMVKGLDPHSAFLDSEAYESLREDTRGEFSGIGVVLTIKDDILTIISPIEGTPAYKAGIKSGDVIVKVNGGSTRDMTISEAVNKIKGKKGTPLTLTILREGEANPLDFDLVRDEIPLESVRATELRPGYGYVSLSNFNENTSRDLKHAIDGLQAGSKPLQGLIFDLRGNPGGLLQQAVKVVDMFISEGVIVSIKGRVGSETQIWEAQEDVDDYNFPLVVLVNSGSASASEIVAGALQDHKRALILGIPSFGKGSVQNIKPLGDGSALKLTIARYYTPSGRSIQAEGIKPDIELKFKQLKKEESGKNTLKEKDLRNHLTSGTPLEGTEDGDYLLKKKGTGVIKTRKLNMRTEPDKSGGLIGVLKKGTKFTILERMENGWLKITHEGDMGYVNGSSKYVEIEAVDDTNGYGTLSREYLLLDSQVKRALELLISHSVFSGLAN